jgi:uncharacterized membrane protein
MKAPSKLEQQIRRWVAAGLINHDTGGRIVAFETGRDRRASLHWPVVVALIFGGLLFAAGVTLFVAAHWPELSPSERFALMIAMVGIFHVGGAAAGNRFPALSTTLHAIGTVTLGGAIFLTAQIFNLHENWAAGVLLWAIGAAIGFLVLRDWAQATALALLAPAWLISQWTVSTQSQFGGDRPLVCGLLLAAISYLCARTGDQENTGRRALVWIGALAILPCAAIAIVIGSDSANPYTASERPHVSSAFLLVSWAAAILGPLLLAMFLRGRAAWMNVLWAVWTYALVVTASHTTWHDGNRFGPRPIMTLALYALCALGSLWLVAWGLHERRKERLNLGIAAFAISVLFFYFDSFMGKLGRSASLLILGALCLTGGYALEMTRRRLVARMEVSQ